MLYVDIMAGKIFDLDAIHDLSTDDKMSWCSTSWPHNWTRWLIHRTIFQPTFQTWKPFCYPDGILLFPYLCHVLCWAKWRNIQPLVSSLSVYGWLLAQYLMKVSFVIYLIPVTSTICQNTNTKVRPYLWGYSVLDDTRFIYLFIFVSSCWLMSLGRCGRPLVAIPPRIQSTPTSASETGGPVKRINGTS